MVEIFSWIGKIFFATQHMSLDKPRIGLILWKNKQEFYNDEFKTDFKTDFRFQQDGF